MAALVRLLGAPSINRDDDEIDPPSGKTSALLFYLAHRRGWVTRDAALALLYPETDEPRARRNLRTLLVTIRRLPGTDGIEIEPGRLRWSVSTDLAAISTPCLTRSRPL